MNCQSLIANLGFDCALLGEDTLRLWSPFTYGADGENVGLYVEPYSGGFRITDNAESLMHVSSMGITLSKSRLNRLRQICGSSVTISEGGEIFTLVESAHISDGIASVLNAAVAVGHFESLWMPRNRSETFTKIVTDSLAATVGEKLIRKIAVVGASGHELELPLAIRANSPPSFIYIQPIAANDDTQIDWNNVYSGFGKMMDLKNAGADDTSRVVVLEDTDNDAEAPKAITMLAQCASVVKYSNISPWAARYA